MALSYIYAAYGNVGFVEALFFGLKAAVLAIVIEAVVRIGKRALRNPSHGRAGGNRLRRHLLLRRRRFRSIIVARRADRFHRRAAGQAGVCGARSTVARSSAVIDSMLGEGVPDHVRPNTARTMRVSAVWLAIWLVPVFAILIALGHEQRVQPDRDLLQQDGDGDVRRSLCRAGLCRAAGGRILPLGHAAARCSTASAWRKPRLAR